MMAKAAPSDLYMNFMDLTVAMNSTNSSTLVTESVSTGLSVRSGLAWLIHKVEVIPGDINGAATAVVRTALSTRKDLTTIPALGDKGCILQMDMGILYSATGNSRHQTPIPYNYLPPIPLAAPTLNVYAQTTADTATQRGKDVKVRIGFTTQEIDNKLYLELAETWGFAN